MANASVSAERLNRAGRSDGPKLMSVPAALDRYGIGRTKLYALIGVGAIRAVKLGSKTLIDVASADAFFDSLPELVESKKGQAWSENAAGGAYPTVQGCG